MPAEAHGLRPRHLGAGDNDGFTFNARRGWNEFAIRAREGEGVEFLAIATVQFTPAAVKSQHRLAVLHLHRLEDRPRADHIFLAVSFVEREQGETLAHVLLVRRMNVPGVVHEVGDDGHAGVRQPQAARLGLPDGGQLLGRIRAGLVAVAEVIVRRELDVVEREVALAPDVAPAFDERLELVGVTRAVVRVHAVRFPLIPECTAQREGLQWRNHRVVNRAGHLVVELVRAGRKLREFSHGRNGLKSHGRRPRLDTCAAPGRFH